jgi:hypothetical protein
MIGHFWTRGTGCLFTSSAGMGGEILVCEKARESPASAGFKPVWLLSLASLA